MIKKILAALFILIFSSTIFAQKLKWENVKFRKAFESETSDDDKAANLSFTLPNDGEDFYAINAGIGYEFLTLNGISPKDVFTGFFVYNYNNQIEKEQQNYKAGLSLKTTFDSDTNNVTLFGTSAGEYLKDFKEDSQSLVITTNWHFQKKDWKVPFGGYANRNKRFDYYLLPEIGAEYQNTYESKTLQTGYDLRSYFSIGGNLLYKKRILIKVEEKDSLGKPILNNNGKPLFHEDLTWRKLLELIVKYEGRNSLLSNINTQTNYTPMYKMQLNLYPVSDSNFAVSFSYNDGANPLEALEKQTFWMFALTYKK